MKDKTKFCHKNNLVYRGKCLSENCKYDYVRETDRKVEERIIDHNKRNKNSYLPRQASKMEHHHIWHEGFKMIRSNYLSSSKREISEVFIEKNNFNKNRQRV